MEFDNIFKMSSNPIFALIFAAAFALIAGMLVQWVLMRLLLRLTRRFSYAENMVKSVAKPMQFLIPILFIQGVWLTAPEDWKWMGKVTHLTGLLFIAVMTWLVTRLIAGAAYTITTVRPLSYEDNLAARQIQTKTKVLARSLMVVTVLVGISLMLMTFPAIKAIGASLLASAGVAGIVAGIAARPVLSNFIAGLQIALGQPLRIDDVLVVEGEWGRVEEITGMYVIVALWDQRRLIVPLQWFIEHPFQNWTRVSSQILGTVFLWVDYSMPLEPLRDELQRICKDAPEWDGRVCLLQTTDVSDRAVQLRALVSSNESGKNWDLRCKVREGLLLYLQKNYPKNLPRIRSEDYMHAQLGAASSQ